jgi:hypothetical protein
MCALSIVAQSLYDITHGMVAFMVYLALDTLTNQKSVEMFIHHGVAFALTLCGLIIYSSTEQLKLPNNLVSDAILRLLLMEITTPVLNAAWYLNSIGSSWARPVFTILLVVWVGFRIVGPILSLIYLYKLWSYDLGLVFSTVYYSILALLVLQIVWFYKLVKIAVSKKEPIPSE